MSYCHEVQFAHFSRIKISLFVILVHAHYRNYAYFKSKAKSYVNLAQLCVIFARRIHTRLAFHDCYTYVIGQITNELQKNSAEIAHGLYSVQIMATFDFCAELRVLCVICSYFLCEFTLVHS